MKKVLAFSPHMTPWGSCIYQEWTLGFCPDNPAGLLIPTWISLVKLPMEYKPVEGLIAASLGTVYATDSQNHKLRDPRFCVGLDLANGWPACITVQGIHLGRNINIAINYEHAPVRCRFCLSLCHKVADCSELKKPGNQERNLQLSPVTDPTQGRTEQGGVDQEGFQQVAHRKCRKGKQAASSSARITPQQWPEGFEQGLEYDQNTSEAMEIGEPSRDLAWD